MPNNIIIEHGYDQLCRFINGFNKTRLVVELVMVILVLSGTIRINF